MCPEYLPAKEGKYGMSRAHARKDKAHTILAIHSIIRGVLALVPYSGLFLKGFYFWILRRGLYLQE